MGMYFISQVSGHTVSIRSHQHSSTSVTSFLLVPSTLGRWLIVLGAAIAQELATSLQAASIWGLNYHYCCFSIWNKLFTYELVSCQKILGDIDFYFYYRWFDAIFLVAAWSTIGIGLVHMRLNNRGTSISSSHRSRSGSSSVDEDDDMVWAQNAYTTFTQNELSLFRYADIRQTVIKSKNKL